jgi:prophage antirepressor-like protein
VCGRPWFIANDVCNALGVSNPTMALCQIEDNERTKLNLGLPGQGQVLIGMVTRVVAKDAAAVLGISNTTMALRTLDADEQALITIEGISRGNKHVNLVNESGLYSLIPQAGSQGIQEVGHLPKVLPSIRKHGMYLAIEMAQEAAEEVLTLRAVTSFKSHYNR